MTQALARTAQLDRALALGWPEMRFIDGAEADTLGVPAEIAGHRFVWTKEEAVARLRQRFTEQRMTIGTGPLGAAEALAFARHVIPFGWAARSFDEAETDVFLLECLVGAEVTCGRRRETPDDHRVRGSARARQAPAS